MGEKWVRSNGTLIRTIPSFEDGTQLRNALKPIPFVRKRESISPDNTDLSVTTSVPSLSDLSSRNLQAQMHCEI